VIDHHSAEESRDYSQEQKPLKAFLLAAGQGSRLRPITDRVPKCLVPIAGKPLLQIWLELLAWHGVREVLVNTHHLPELLQSFASGWPGHPKLHLSHEETLLGSAGTLGKNWDFVATEENFLVCYADNLTDINLGELIQFHQSHDGLVTMALFRTERPKECGVTEMDEDGLITSFEEKPALPKSSLANAGIYVMRPGIEHLLLHTQPSDIGFHLLPRCVGRMYGWLWEGLLMDIGNPQAYALAQEVWDRKQDPWDRPESGDSCPDRANMLASLE
jgi:mannose-1-phosphate guanylyltransferase